MKLTPHYKIAVFLFVLFQGSDQADAASIRAVSVPPGFEELAKIGELVRIELHIAGKSIGFFDARVTADNLTFTAPEQILARLPLKKNLSLRERALLLEKLQGPMARHDRFVCGYQGKQTANCNYIATQNIDMIYDEAEETATIFIKKSFLATTQKKDPIWFTADPDTRRGYVQRQSLSIAGSSDYQTLSLNARAALGITQKSYLVGDYGFSYNESQWGRQSAFDVSNLYYRSDIGHRYYAQMGRMDARDLSSPLGGTFGFALLPLPTIDGARIGTTQAYDNAAAASKRTPVTVLLSQDARVDVYRGPRLLTTNYLHAGIQQIDTSEFPPGTYLLTLHIIVNDHEIRSESLPFTRIDGGWDAPGAFQWFLQAGKAVPEGYADTSGSMVLLGGIKLALTSNTSLTYSLEAYQCALFSEARIDWRHTFSAGSLDANAAVFASSNGARGTSESLEWIGPYAAALTWSEMASANDATSSTSTDMQFLTATVSHSLWGWTLSTAFHRAASAWSYIDTEAVSPRFSDCNGSPDPAYYASVGSTFQRLVHQRTQSASVQFSLAHGFTWRGLNINADANLYLRRVNGRHDNGFFLSMQINHMGERNNADAMSLSNAITFDMESGKRGMGGDVGMSANAYRQGRMQQSAGASVQTDWDGNANMGAFGRVAGDRGSVSVGMQERYDRRFGIQPPSFNGTYAGTISASRMGVFLGPDASDDMPIAGIVVGVSGGDANTHQPLATVRSSTTTTEDLRTGKNVFIPQNAYQPIDVDIEDPTASRGDAVASVKSGAGKHTWFILPGHFGTQAATAELTYTYVGTLLDNDNKPLKDAVILDGDFVSTNDDGAFVSDFHHRPNIVDVMQKKSLFECVMPKLKTIDALLNVHSVHCLPIRPSMLTPAVLANRVALKALADSHILNPEVESPKNVTLANKNATANAITE
jgi:hypothetical protein